MTNDEIDAMYRSLGLRTESLRLARERATTPGELAVLDEVEAQIREDARRYAAAVRKEHSMATTTRMKMGHLFAPAPVQGDYGPGGVNGVIRPPGTISWPEHLEAWKGYDKRYPGGHQDAARIAERGGFAYAELVLYFGREPSTWKPRERGG